MSNSKINEIDKNSVVVDYSATEKQDQNCISDFDKAVKQMKKKS